MSSRTYLSIGDVLSLLREEFPDVTISKIRFLESQGLVNPERSPSGYRKFFEADVERLRYVLRQQREHFLPLKVIRDRLAEGDLGEDGDPADSEVKADGVGAKVGPVAANGAAAQHAAVGVGAAPNGTVAIGGAGASGVGRHAASITAEATPSGGPSRSEEELLQADTAAMARILADASRRAARMPESAKAAVDSPPAVSPEVAASSTTAPPSPRPTPSAPVAPVAAAAAGSQHTRSETPAPTPAERGSTAGGGSSGTSAPTAPTAPTASGAKTAATAKAATAKDAAAKDAAASGTGSASGPGSGRAPAEAPKGTRPASTTSSMVTGASLTADELCSAAGLSEVELASLEGFGLIESVQVAGLATYNEDALIVANLAAELRVYGIEPRHLRLYKNAVDREVGLIEQVIIPLLRQRNPESRQRAIESAEQLGTLGQTMRTTLLRAALRQHIGG